MNRVASILLLALVGTAMLLPAAHAAGAGKATGKTLEKLDEQWSDDAAKKDVKQVVSYYATDAVVYPPNEPMAMGRAAAEKVWAEYFALPEFTISWKTIHAEVSKSGELGYTSGTYVDSYKGPDGKIVSENGKYVCVWKKQTDGKWKAIHDTWNSDSK